MKRSIMARILAVLLMVSMVCPTAVSAAGFGLGSGSPQSIGDWVRSTVGQIISGWTRPGQGSGSDSGSGSGSGSQSWDLIEDSTTVLNGDMLRASTYGLSDSGTSVQADSGTTLKYFPVTLYDYDENTINNATHLKEVTANADLTMWEGLYFSAGAPTEKSFTYATSASAHTDLTWAQVQKGTYYSDEACTRQVTVSAVTETGYEKASVTCDSLISSNYSRWVTTSYYYTPDNGANYYPLYAKRSSSSNWGSNKQYTYTWGYSTTGNGFDVTTIGTQSAAATSNPPDIDVYTKTSITTGYTLTANGKTLATLNSTDTTQKVGVTLYSKGGTTSTIALKYANWNWWKKNNGDDADDADGQKFYTGLLNSELDANKNPVFTVPDGGIFNSDSSVKSIYTNVEMPFVYDSASKTYSFDASQNGVYFHADTTQGSSGTAASNTRLYFNEGNPQIPSGIKWGDGSATVWAPFDDKSTLTGSESIVNMNYHFGMRATIPFTMTSNGRMNENNDESEAIKFSFSGDDDVWVFIDGHLVIDLGGIHNRLDAEIDFANNKVTYSVSNAKKDEYATGSYNDSDFDLEQTLFGGLISQDRETFAASETHELTIFYLERGKGSSNCKISFNLPMKDTVTVTKRASLSWYHEEGDYVNGRENALTDKEQETVNNISYGFTLYKSTDGESFTPVANTKYKILDVDGQVIDSRSTDKNGHFYLKNNTSARFVTEFSSSGTTYYVVEDNVSSSGFVTPDFTYGGTAADGFAVDEKKYESGTQIPEYSLPTNAEENKSNVVTVYGSDESEDSLIFICENFLDATMPNPSAFPSDDKIVLDYGLSVNINLLGNDVYRGDSIEVLAVYGGDVTLTDEVKGTVYEDLELDAIVASSGEPVYGEATLNGNTVSYQLNKQLTGVEVLTYLVKVTGSADNAAGEKVIAYAYALGTVYIIPATTMYYEENFGFVEFKDGTYGGWKVVGTPDGQAQEPGVVGTTTDSPYGSDVAYLSDTRDSNGTSRYVNTTNGAAQFSYTFTGTGTTFYARTSNNSGYMRVQISGGSIQDKTILRDTYFDDTNSEVKGTLYNIPVYSSGTLPYGTYTVTVTIAKYTQTAAMTCHSEFWLDGIRVFNPLNPEDDNYQLARSAYAADGETGMTSVTLRNQLLSNVTYVLEEREIPVQRFDDEGNPVLKENGDPVYDRVVEKIEVPQWPGDDTFVMFTDTNGKIQSAAEYESIGPKEEVYLYSGQYVTFTLTNWDPNINRLFLGMKSPTGKSGQVTIGSQTINVSNTTDCYYEISNYGKIETAADGTKTVTYVIEAGEGVLISLTDLKITGNPEFTIPGEDFDAENADFVVEEDDGTVPAEDVAVEENGESGSEPANDEESETQPEAPVETDPVAQAPEETEAAEEPETTEETVEGDE